GGAGRGVPAGAGASRGRGRPEQRPGAGAGAGRGAGVPAQRILSLPLPVAVGESGPAARGLARGAGGGAAALGRRVPGGRGPVQHAVKSRTPGSADSTRGFTAATPDGAPIRSSPEPAERVAGLKPRV